MSDSESILCTGADKTRCRILYVVGQLGSGGLERQLFYLLRAMDRSLYLPSVAVWNFSKKDVYVSRIQELNVPVYPISQSNRLAKLREFRRLVRRLKPEVVHSYSFYTNFAAWYAALGFKALPIGSVRQNFNDESRTTGKALGRLSACLPSKHICNSQAAKKTIEGIYKEGDTVLLIEDVIVSGASVLSATDTLRRARLPAIT